MMLISKANVGLTLWNGVIENAGLTRKMSKPIKHPQFSDDVDEADQPLPWSASISSENTYRFYFLFYVWGVLWYLFCASEGFNFLCFFMMSFFLRLYFNCMYREHNTLSGFLSLEGILIGFPLGNPSHGLPPFPVIIYCYRNDLR